MTNLYPHHTDAWSGPEAILMYKGHAATGLLIWVVCAASQGHGDVLGLTAAVVCVDVWGFVTIGNHGRAGFDSMGKGELALTLAWGGWSWWRPGLTNSATTQAYIQGFELASLIYSTYDLLEQRDRSRIIATGFPPLRATARYLREVLVKVQYWWCTQYNKHLQIKLFWQKSTLCNILQLPRPLGQMNMWWRGGKYRGVKFFSMLWGGYEGGRQT